MQRNHGKHEKLFYWKQLSIEKMQTHFMKIKFHFKTFELLTRFLWFFVRSFETQTFLWRELYFPEIIINVCNDVASREMKRKFNLNNF
jgi:hypothetical protein